MSLHALANNMAAQGRGPDSTLVHMSPREVHGLQALAMANGGTLTINPQTGLPEAGFLDSLLPALIGFGLNTFAPVLGTAVGGMFGLGGAAGTAIAVGGAYGLATGSLEKGLTAGLGAFGGAGLGSSLTGVPNTAADAGWGARDAGISAAAETSPAATAARLQAGANTAMSAPADFVKSNYMNLGMAAAPALTGALDQQTSSAPKIHPGHIRKYDRDPVTGTLYQVSATPADQYTGGINFGGVPQFKYGANGGLMGYDDGGVTTDKTSTTNDKSVRFGGVPELDLTGGNMNDRRSDSERIQDYLMGMGSNPFTVYHKTSVEKAGEATKEIAKLVEQQKQQRETGGGDGRGNSTDGSGGFPAGLAPAANTVAQALGDMGLNSLSHAVSKAVMSGAMSGSGAEAGSSTGPNSNATNSGMSNSGGWGSRDAGGGTSGGPNSGGSPAGKAARDGSGFGGTGSGVGGDGGSGGGEGPGGSMGGPNGGGSGPTGGNAPSGGRGDGGDGPGSSSGSGGFGRGARGGYLDHGRFVQRYDEGGTAKKINFGGVGQLEPVNTSDSALSDSERTQNYLMGNGPNPFAFHYSNEKKVVPATKASDDTGIAAIGGGGGGGSGGGGGGSGGGGGGISDLVSGNGDVSSIVNKSDTGGQDFGVTNQPSGTIFDINDFDNNTSAGTVDNSVNDFDVTDQSDGETFNTNDLYGNTNDNINGEVFDVTDQSDGETFDEYDLYGNTSAETVQNDYTNSLTENTAVGKGGETGNSLIDNDAVGEIGDFTGDTNSSVFGVTNQPDDATFDINKNEGYFGGFYNGSGSGSDSGGSFGSGFGSGGGCPAPWINITLADGGTVKAGDIKPGMIVYTRHETTGEWGNFPVTVVRNGKDNRWTILFESGIEFVGTFNHPVMVDDAWVEIQHLKAGDKVVQPEGFAVVKSAKYFDHGPIVKIEVQDAHTYLTEGFLSHNKNMADYDFGNMRTEGFEFDDADFYADGGTTGSGSIDLHVPINIGGGGGFGGSDMGGGKGDDFGGGFARDNPGMFGGMSQPAPDFLSKQQESLPGYIAMQKSQQDYNNSDEFKNFKNYAQEYQRQFQPQQQYSAFGGGMGGGRGGLRQDQRMYPMAEGGIAALAQGGYNLGSYSDGGRLLRGPGDGVSDSIPATIGKNQPARLADGEFVVPARIVSELGNGSTEAGARKLYAMMDRVQKSRAKTTGKNKIAANTRADKYLPV